MSETNQKFPTFAIFPIRLDHERKIVVFEYEYYFVT